MDLDRCLKDAGLGAVLGAFIGAVLWVPVFVIGDWVMHWPSSVANTIFWVCAVGGTLIALFIAIVDEGNKDTARKEAAEERERQEQATIRTSLMQSHDTSLKLFEDLPQRLLTSEQLLDQAERDFKEGAFSPFWSSIEQATLQLGSFDDGLRVIGANIKSYGELKNRYKDSSPNFPITTESLRKIAAANSTNDRLSAIVRQAHRNHQFASIYEQRRTSRILSAGFTSLGEAIDGMGNRVISSINNVREAISEMSDRLGEIQATNVSMKKCIDDIHDSVSTAAAESAKRADRDWEALDNIQRGRKPLGQRDKDIIGLTEPAPWAKTRGG